MPPSDSRLKVTMSPCLRLTSSTQSFGRETMRVEYPTFWTFRASIMRDIVYIFYTNEKKKVGYIREPLSMVFLYLAWKVRHEVAGAWRCVDGSRRVICWRVEPGGVGCQCECPEPVVVCSARI